MRAPLIGAPARATTGARLAVVVLAGVVVLGAAAAHAQPAQPAQPAAPPASAPAEPAPAASSDAKAASETPAPGDAAPSSGHGASSAAHAPANQHGAAGAGDHGESHGESVWVTLARIANFVILAGILYWFGRKPIAEHLASRGAQIRRDLVDAADMRATATARLSEIESKLAALPAELEQMRVRSAEELEAERARIRATAEAERDRLVEQARREIAAQTRNARADLRAYAASLAVEVADARLRSTLTPAEQSALVDQYASQMRNVQ